MSTEREMDGYLNGAICDWKWPSIVTKSCNPREAHHVIYPYLSLYYISQALTTFGIPALISFIRRLLQNVATWITADLLTYHGHSILTLPSVHF